MTSATVCRFGDQTVTAEAAYALRSAHRANRLATPVFLCIECGERVSPSKVRDRAFLRHLCGSADCELTFTAD